MPIVELQYKPESSVPIYIENLHRHDNDLFEKQIRESGDAQDKKTNVKAEMTQWLLTEYESFRNLGVDIVVNHLPHLTRPTIEGSTFDWIIIALWGNIIIREIIQTPMTICREYIRLHIMLKFQTGQLLLSLMIWEKHGNLRKEI